ncbi:MAG TPA: GNAT family N-acetyltransferase [Anaerolineae bacterium]|nr:GNAT family N-acetyltransferase [Anaerolineae bacterium]
MESHRFPPADYTVWNQFFPSPITARPAQLEDTQPLHQLCYSERPFLRFQHHFHHCLKQQARGRGIWLALQHRRRLIGAGHLITYSHEGELADLFVHTNYRSQGIGSAMIHLLIHIAQQQHLNALEIGVLATNHRAYHLYQRLGFTLDRQIQLNNGHTAFILRQDII